MKKHLHLFPDIRSKGERENRLPCQCILQTGGFRYRCRWDWARFPEELEGCTVAGVACDSRNNVYAAVRAPGCPGVAKFSPEGAFLGYYAKNLDLGRAHGIFLDREDCLWLTDDTFHVVCRLDQSDRLLKTLGVFRQGSDTGVDASIDSHLRYLTIRRTAGPFNMPTGVAQGPDGDIYVSDGYGNAAVHRFSPEGALLRTWGAPGNAPGEFNIPHGPCADSQGRVWVADRDNDRVQIFDPDGRLLHILPGLLYPTGVWSGGEHFYISELDGRVSIYDMEFRRKAQLGYAASQYKAHSIGGDRDGNLYLGQFASYQLAKLERID